MPEPERPGVRLARLALEEAYRTDCAASRLRPVVAILLADGDARIVACCPRHAAGLLLARPLRPATDADALDAALWCVALWIGFGAMPRRRNFAVRLVPADTRILHPSASWAADFLPRPPEPDIPNALEALRTCARTDIFQPVLEGMLQTMNMRKETR